MQMRFPLGLVCAVALLCGCEGAGGSEAPPSLTQSGQAGTGNGPTQAPPQSQSTGPDTLTTQPETGASGAVISSALVVIDANGKVHPLYVFDNDVPSSGSSACTGQCEALFPPLEPPTTNSVMESGFGTIARAGDSLNPMQATFKGRPLYEYAQDSLNADAIADGSNLFSTNGTSVWHVATP
jgi:predicted lipoprotein with Yx(FWY)xxD motif